MYSKFIKIALASALLFSTTAPSLNVLANETTQTPPPTTDPPAVSEGDETTPSTTDAETPEETNDAEPAVTSTELESSKAENIKKDVYKILIDLGANGKEAPVQFTDPTKKVENTKLLSDILLAQLQMYELLYSTEIEKELTKPATAATFKEDAEFGSLEDLFTGYNAITLFIDKQIAVMEETTGYDENLLAALKLLKTDTQFVRKEEITPDKPLSIDIIRLEMQKSLNASTALAPGVYFKYLNDGKESDDITTLTSADLKDTTKDLINLVKQWGDLPHIPNASDSIKILAMNSANQDWLTALSALIESMTQDTQGGTTTGPTDVPTSPELATSVLGRLGSSLFTVSRAENADDDPNKPITNTLGWHLDETQKNSSDKFDPGPAAKDDFLAMFAATSMYVPFISKVGDKDYVEAYKSLFNETATPLPDDSDKVVYAGSALGPLDILSQVQNLKKPLYYYNDLEKLGKPTIFGNSTSDVKGVAQLLTVADLIMAIEKKKEVAAVTMHGVLEQSGDSWAFYNYSLNKDGLVNTTVPTATPPSDNTDVVVEVPETGGEETTTTTAPAPTQGSSGGAAGIPMTNKIPADRTINGGQDTTRVVFEMTYNEKNPGAALLTGAIMNNIYKDTVIKSRFKERQSEAVYIDAVGNLVLNDGLVVLPAATNPTYWAMPNNTENQSNEIQSWTYNPYTVAFMDTYPAIYQSGKAPAAINDKKDKNKYLVTTLGFSLEGGFAVLPIKKGYKNNFTISRSGAMYTQFKLDGIPESDDSLVTLMKDGIGVDGKEEVANDKWYNIVESAPVKFNNLVSNKGNSIFPYVNYQDADPTNQESFSTNSQDYTSAILIAKNMYAYLLGEVESGKENVTPASGTSAGGSSSGKLREGFMFNNVTMPVLTGVTNGSEFDKTNAKSDLLLAGGDTGLVQKWIINGSKWLVNNAGQASNILAISNPDEVSVLKLLYGVFIEYGFYIIFILIIFLIILFIREGEFFNATIKGFFVVGILFVTMFLVPFFVPWITNFTTSPLSKDTVLNTLMTKLELTEKVHTVEPAGSSGLSVKLYNFSPAQAKDINDEHFMEGNYLTNKFSINDNIGMYVQGTELRLDLYSFMRFNPLIISTKDYVNDPNEVETSVPQIYHSNHSKSVFVDSNDSLQDDMEFSNDLINFYMPYNLVQDGFMDTLNKYLKHYDPAQSIVRYPNGLVKSSYIMNSYMKSLAFLSAEPEVAGLISTEQTEDGYSHLGITKAEVDLVNKEFYPYGDVLGLQSWVDTEWEDLPNTYGSSLWGQNLYNLGYYNQGDGIIKRTHLANRVNRKAYDIIMRMSETQGLVSDETMIKVVALYATMEFNREISYQGHNIYPRTASLNEISANDILSATVLGQSKQYMFYDTSLVSNVYFENGIVGLFFLAIAITSLVVYSIVLSIVLPVLIIGLVVYSIYLVLAGRNIMPALKFVTKVLALTVVANLALVIVIRTYIMYTNIYVFACLLLLVVAIFVYLFYRILFKRKDRLGSSWQNKHLRRMGGRGYGNNYDRYDSYDQYPRNYNGYPGNDYNDAQDYLREEGGTNARRGQSSDRYNY